jgi:hypothetical protein
MTNSNLYLYTLEPINFFFSTPTTATQFTQTQPSHPPFVPHPNHTQAGDTIHTNPTTKPHFFPHPNHTHVDHTIYTNPTTLFLDGLDNLYLANLFSVDQSPIGTLDFHVDSLGSGFVDQFELGCWGLEDGQLRRRPW